MPAFVFTPGRMLAGATPLRLMPVPLTCAELLESPIPLLEIAPPIPVLGFAKTITLVVRGVVAETAPREYGPTTDRAVAAAPVGKLT